MKPPIQKNEIWDVVVIGGGPAGMMAAGRAGERGKRVLLLEKNPELGKKLLITGGGRCNVTNNKRDNRIMLAKYKGNDQYLFSAFAQWNVKSTIEFFNKRGMETKEENEGRIFPVSNTAQSVWDVLHKYMKEGNVKIENNKTVSGISESKDATHLVIKVKGGENIFAKSCILATGGTSRPETGSTGDGFRWLQKLGHTVIENEPSLVPIALKDLWTKKISGLTLNDIKLTTFQNEQKQEAHKGKVLFTHFGISGPTVLNMSKEVGELLKYGDTNIVLDLFPHLDYPELKSQLQRILIEESNKKIKNALGRLIPTSLVSSILELAEISGETFNHSVKSEDRIKLVNTMKVITLHVKALLGVNKAVVSSGGVVLKEVNFKNMRSRKLKHLYIVGDVLNIDRPSGGYSLQLCWTTGYVAGNNV